MCYLFISSQLCHPSHQTKVPYRLPHRPLKAAVKPESRGGGVKAQHVWLIWKQPSVRDQWRMVSGLNISHQAVLVLSDQSRLTAADVPDASVNSFQQASCMIHFTADQRVSYRKHFHVALTLTSEHTVCFCCCPLNTSRWVYINQPTVTNNGSLHC